LSAGNATNFYFNQFLVIEGTQYVTKNIFAGTDRLVSKTEATVLTTPLRHFYHGDQVGSTSYITDASKTLVQHERYFPFGERWADPGAEERAATNGASGPIYPRNWLFTSKELDTDTGYYYYGARYYDARNARWLSADPILPSYMQGDGNSGVFNPRNTALYSYSWNNPVVLRDPDGRCVATGSSGPCDERMVETVSHPRTLPEPGPWEHFWDGFLGSDRNDTWTNVGGAASSVLFFWTAMRGGARPTTVGPVESAAIAEPPTESMTASAPTSGLKSGVPSSTIDSPPGTPKYVRPSGAGPTSAQKAAVQGKPCVDCGSVTARQVADHKDPLVVQHYREGSVDVFAQSKTDAVQPQCPTCSSTQGGQLSALSRRQWHSVQKQGGQ